MKPKRETRRSPCVSCAGKGSVSHTKRVKCSDCNGLGWTEAASGNELVCAKCNGDGKVDRVEESTCADCKGKGYAVRVVELSTIEVECDKCHGTKFVTGDLICCPDCLGEGTAQEDEQYIDCPYCDGDGHRHDFVCLDCNGAGRIVDPASSDFLRCKRCLGKGEIEDNDICPKCHGKGIVSQPIEIDVTPGGS